MQKAWTLMSLLSTLVTSRPIPFQPGSQSTACTRPARSMAEQHNVRRRGPEQGQSVQVCEVDRGDSLPRSLAQGARVECRTSWRGVQGMCVQGGQRVTSPSGRAAAHAVSCAGHRWRAVRAQGRCRHKACIPTAWHSGDVLVMQVRCHDAPASGEVGSVECPAVCRSQARCSPASGIMDQVQQAGTAE